MQAELGQILLAFLDERLTDAFELMRLHDVNPNTFDGRPLMHVLAMCGKLLGACTVLREEFGADPDLVDENGYTPLSLALLCSKGEDHADVSSVAQRIAQVIGARLDLPQTLFAVARDGVRHATSVDEFIKNGLNVASTVPMIHLFNKQGVYIQFAQELLDRYPERQSPLERNKDGRTLFECKGVKPELLELLRDAMEEPQQRAVTIMMGLHQRLGSDSPLRILDIEMLRSFILPLTTTARHTTIADFRRIKLDALINAEGLTSIDKEMQDEYLNRAGMFVPMRFRRSHFLNINREIFDEESYNADKADRDTCMRLEWRGVLFDEPYTPEYEARAREADGFLSSEWK